MNAGTKRIHAVEATAANVADSRVLPALRHGGETAAWGGQACQGQAAVLAERAPQAEDRTNRCWRANLKQFPEVRGANRVRGRTRSRSSTSSPS